MQLPCRVPGGGLTVSNYVAGQPFPNLDPKDPQFPLKIMWNYEYGFVNGLDDTDLRNFDADTGTIPPGGSMTVERHFLLDHLRRLFWTGRLYVDPKPEKPNPNGYRVQQGLYPILEPFDLKGVGALGNRYIDSAKQDDSWLYLPSLRRVRRLSTAQRSDALFGQDTDVDSYYGYAGQVSWMDWKYLGEKEVLGPVHAEHFPVKWAPKADWAFDDVWEKRKVYVIEGTSKLPQYAYSKRVLFIDKEYWGIPFSDIYDRSGELWKIWINDLSFRKSVPGNNAVVYDDALRAGHRHGRSAARARDQGVAAEPAVPGRAGVVLPPGREGRDDRRLVHGRCAGGGRAVIGGRRGSERVSAVMSAWGGGPGPPSYGCARYHRLVGWYPGSGFAVHRARGPRGSRRPCRAR
jgi:Protein of unknown function (DUF1329)